MCYQLDTIPAQLTYEQRNLRESRQQRWRSFARPRVVFLNVLLPGLGFVASGRALVGALLMMLASAGLGLLVLNPNIMAVPYSLGAERLFDGRLQVGVFLIGIAYLVSIVLGYLLSRES